MTLGEATRTRYLIVGYDHDAGQSRPIPGEVLRQLKKR